MDYVDGPDLEWIRSRLETSHLKGRPAFEGGPLIVPIEAEISSIESNDEKVGITTKGIGTADLCECLGIDQSQVDAGTGHYNKPDTSTR